MDTRPAPLYLDDIAPGQRFTTGSVAVEAEQIVAFARDFDPQPFHLDAAAARDSVFGGLAASGWHTAALTMGLLVREGAPIAGGLVGAGTQLTWPRPTRPGDVLRVVSEVLAVTPSRSRPDRGTVTLRSETLNQHDEVVQIQVATLMVPRRPPAARPADTDARGTPCCAA